MNKYTVTKKHYTNNFFMCISNLRSAKIGDMIELLTIETNISDYTNTYYIKFNNDVIYLKNIEFINHFKSIEDIRNDKINQLL